MDSKIPKGNEDQRKLRTYSKGPIRGECRTQRMFRFAPFSIVFARTLVMHFDIICAGMLSPHVNAFIFLNLLSANKNVTVL